MATVITIQTEGQPVNVGVEKLETGNTTTTELQAGQRTTVVLQVGEELHVSYPVQDV